MEEAMLISFSAIQTGYQRGPGAGASRKSDVKYRQNKAM